MTVTMSPPDVDDLDGLPVSDHEPGQPLAPGLRAVERLGVGHRCETWLAWSTALWCPAVVKLPRPHQTDHPRARQSLAREATALRRAGHPGLPRLMADGTAAAAPHLVMEYVEGPTVADLVDAHGPRRPLDVARLGAQLLPALLALHRAGLAHLDVKPENVVVRDGRPVLVDCGSARRLGSAQPPGHPVGTLGYAAPEMELCLPVSAGMDLFGLGTVLAEMLAGTPYPDGVELTAGPLTDLVEAMLTAEPAQRPTPVGTLRALAAAAGPGRLWPAWLDL